MFGRPAGCLVWQKLWRWILHSNFSTKYVQICHVYGHSWLLLVYTTFNDLDLAWRSQSQRRSKLLGFIISYTFHFTRTEFYVVLEPIKLNIPRLLLSKIYWNKRNNCCFADSVKTTLTLACNWTFVNRFDSNLVWWYNFYTIALYIMILVKLTLTLIQGHRSAKNHKLLRQLPHKVFNPFK